MYQTSPRRHLPGDVLAGAALGTACALLFWLPPVRSRLHAVADWVGEAYDRLMRHAPRAGATLVILLAVMAVALAALTARRPWRQSSSKTPLDILSDRYARGDIDTADYEQRRSALEGLT